MIVVVLVAYLLTNSVTVTHCFLVIVTMTEP